MTRLFTVGLDNKNKGQVNAIGLGEQKVDWPFLY